MSKTNFWWRAVATLVLVGLLITGGVALYYTAWSGGYSMGQSAAEGETVAPRPYMHPMFGHPGRFLAFGLFIVGGLFFFGLVTKLIRFIIWGAAFSPMMARMYPPHWSGDHWRRSRRWHRTHGPVPPWCWGWDEPDETADEANTEANQAPA